MRSLVAVGLVVLLAGCTVPEDAKEDPLFGLCPQWVEGPGEQTISLHLADNASEVQVLGPADPTAQGHPLDLYRFTLTNLSVDGELQVRAQDATGHRLAIRDYRQEKPQLVPVIVVSSRSVVGHEFEVFLTPISENGTAAPAPASLEFRLAGSDADLGVHVTFLYRVCGL